MRRLLLFMILGGLAHAQSHVQEQPTLRDTLEWLTGTSKQESGDGSEYIEFESKGCQAVITEHRVKAKPEFIIRLEFNFADIDPSDFSLIRLDTGKMKELFHNQTSVKFHTRNYAEKMKDSDSRDSSPVAIAWYEFTTDSDFAPRFAKAMKRAATLCGAKPASF